MKTQPLNINYSTLHLHPLVAIQNRCILLIFLTVKEWNNSHSRALCLRYPRYFNNYQGYYDSSLSQVPSTTTMTFHRHQPTSWREGMILWLPCFQKRQLPITFNASCAQYLLLAYPVLSIPPRFPFHFLLVIYVRQRIPCEICRVPSVVFPSAPAKNSPCSGAFSLRAATILALSND